MGNISVKNKVFSSVAVLLHEVELHLLGILALLFLGFSLTLFIPTLIFRPIARASRKYLRPDLGDILSVHSCLFAQSETEDFTNNIIVIQITIQGVITHEEFINIFQKRIINCKRPDGKLRYPELQQFITNWMGYKFWKWEHKFNLREHILYKVSGNNILSSEDLKDLGDQLVSKPFQKGKSPWEVTLIPRITPDMQETTEFFFRFNHSLADGFSILYLFQRLVGYQKPKNAVAPKRSTVNLSYFLLLPLKVLRAFGELAYNSLSHFLWKIPQGQKSSQYFHCTSKKIPVDTIKEIKNQHDVSFVSVVYTLIAGGIRNLLLEDSEGPKVLPSGLPSIILVPVSGSHPDKLTNKFSIILTCFPLEEPDPVKRLKLLHKNFENFRDSPVPLVAYWLSLLHGCHFNFVGRIINNHRQAPILTTYFPVGDDWVLEGKPFSEFGFYASFSQGEYGAMFSISSFRGNISITPIFNAAVLRKMDVARLTLLMDAETSALLNSKPATKKHK